MIRLNHKTMKFRMIQEHKTVARVDEVETGHTPGGRIHRGYSYTGDGRRILEAQIPAEPRQPIVEPIKAQSLVI